MGLNELNPFSMLFKIGIEKKALKIPNDCNKNLAEMMRDCWKFDPEERPDFRQLEQRLSTLTSIEDSDDSTVVQNCNNQNELSAEHIESDDQYNNLIEISNEHSRVIEEKDDPVNNVVDDSFFSFENEEF